MPPSRSPNGRQPHIVAINDDAMVLGLLRDLLDSFSYKDKDKKLTRPDRKVVFEWSSKGEKRVSK